MTDYTLYTVSPPRYVHSRCFEELSLGLAAGLRELNYQVRETTRPDEIVGRAILLGGHLLPYHPHSPIPADAIIYNTEQVDRHSDWITGGYIGLLKRRVVWDYSPENIRRWQQHGIAAVYCGIGYVPELTRIPPADHEDIDVLFYGSINERRQGILQQLMDTGINVYIAPPGTYGKERDALIARAKIILNLHYYEAAVFEMVRCSYLFANGKCVVTEGPGDAQPGYFNVPYERLVSACLELLDNEAKRRTVITMGTNFFLATRQRVYLESALAATASPEQPALPE